MSVGSCRQLSPASSDVSLHDPGAVLKLSEDLAALISEGLIVAENDEGTVRYRPTQRAIARAA